MLTNTSLEDIGAISDSSDNVLEREAQKMSTGGKKSSTPAQGTLESMFSKLVRQMQSNIVVCHPMVCQNGGGGKYLIANTAMLQSLMGGFIQRT